MAIEEEEAFATPFGRLLHFTKDIDTPQPKVLVVAPLSGHFATLLRDTAATLLQDHDVYITDWTNARDVPRSAGTFGVEDYVAYLIRFLEEMGERPHVLAVCQPCVQTLAAVAVMDRVLSYDQPYDAVIQAGYGEHGREGLQELLDVPVVDITEAAASTAQFLGGLGESGGRPGPPAPAGGP